MAPSWSPDGKKIAYVSFGTGRPVIYVQDLATGEREAMASFKGLNSALAMVRPSGNTLALALKRPSNVILRASPPVTEIW
jgi:TolB protein